MSKRVLFFAITLTATFVVAHAGSAFANNLSVTSTEPAAASVQNVQPVQNASAVNGQKVAARVDQNRYRRPRIGLGFNGIPFDGSHREAIQLHRAYRNGR